jgi:hypothetical protein
MLQAASLASQELNFRKTNRKPVHEGLIVEELPHHHALGKFLTGGELEAS